MTVEKDLVLVYLENEPLFFARVEDIKADVKPDWYHVKMLLLQIPLQTVTWILRDIYISGGTFTMNGKEMRLEKVVCPADPDDVFEDDEDEEEIKEAPGAADVISLSDRKKNGKT
ncbi:MAG: hypothetical protein K9L30_08435 [Desulfobacterales bacterium]|nr:hypothetical protein [Desulfobacterales bacterium]